MATVAILRLARCGQFCPRAVGTVFIQKRDKSDVNLVNYKRGKGGRSSFSGFVTTVFGGSGFVGRVLINRLGKIGSQIVIPYRGDYGSVAPLKLCGDLGQILFHPFDLHDEEAIRKSMMYSNVVINLIGSDSETRNWNYQQVHVDAPRKLARIARECGVDKFVQFSAMSASDKPQTVYIKSGSEFLRTKHQGELAVREEFPEAIIFRPSDIFGNEDRFLSYYADKARRLDMKPYTLGWGVNTMPLWMKGDATIKYPVYVGNVADGVINALRDPTAAGKTFELLGPEPYYLSDLVDYILNGIRHPLKRTELGMLFRLKIYSQKFNVNGPSYTLERIERDMVTDNPTGAPTLEDLGIKLTRLEEKAMFILKSYRVKGYYEEYLGEFEDKPPPPASVQQTEYVKS